jgi:hypothetical protein
MRRLIKADGTEQDLPAPVSMREIAALIGADTMDTVVMRHMGMPLHVMVVDDAGWETAVVKVGEFTRLEPIRPLKPINAKATELYLRNCRPGTTHQIAGDVVVVPDEDYQGD